LIDLDFEADPVAGDETTSVREDIDALHPGQEAPRRDDELERVRVLQLVDVGALAVVARQDEESVAGESRRSSGSAAFMVVGRRSSHSYCRLLFRRQLERSRERE
jgi:hypothetical protein